MTLNESLKDYNRKANDRLVGFKITEFINESNLPDYRLAHFINIFKIRRMYELQVIDEDTMNYLLKLIKKYSTKEHEAVSYGKQEGPAFIDIVDRLIKEMKDISCELQKYGINPNPHSSIKLEDVINYDIDRKSYTFVPCEATKMYSQEQMKQFSDLFVTRVLKLTSKDKDNIKLYNITKIEFLTAQKYLNPVYKDFAIELYEQSFKEQNEEALKELTSDPYNLVMDRLNFDFTSFIDYVIRRDTSLQLGDPKGMYNRYEEELSRSIR